MWRTTVDIERNWASVMAIADTQAHLAQFSRPHNWNDPDMLQAGNPGLTAEEEATHFALWCFFAAPLMAGHDPRTMTESVQKLITNEPLLAIDQDVLGQAAVRTQPMPEVDVWSRPLNNGEAWLIVNKTEQALQVIHHNGQRRLNNTALATIPTAARVLPLRGGEKIALAPESTREIPAHGCLPIIHQIQE
ncbi:hypothetical protein CVV68_03670 [Arthrobacter livingstonensis]|uniref:Alpha-galactosidase n=1 Tax=Arthrobacter livingstonensis TaxID=670078 RepID=A0A2V5LB98_9MICC|nr:hypothetical protein CVV68_03670 [Arthrobacter livingstonensis]